MVAPDEFLDAEDVDVEVIEAPHGKAVAVVGRREAVAGLIRPVAKPAEVIEAQEAVRTLIEKALKPERDYGRIKNTDRDVLYKPGAERINAAFGTAARYKIVEKEIDHDRPNVYRKRYDKEDQHSQGLYRYVLLCQLVHRESGVVIGEGVGSCSTMESKYIDRPRDVENTILKMAKKRAYVDATLTTFGLSEQFTQDVEDMDLTGNEGRDSGPFSLDSRIGFGKHGEKTWSEVLKEDLDYVEWAVENMEKIGDDAKAALRAALKGDAPPVSAPSGKIGGEPPADSEAIPCPKCGGGMYDNRGRKNSPKSPDLKCKDKDGCGHAIWLDGWEKELRQRIDKALAAGAIDGQTKNDMDDDVTSLSPVRMLAVHKRIDRLAREAA